MIKRTSAMVLWTIAVLLIAGALSAQAETVIISAYAGADAGSIFPAPTYSESFPWGASTAKSSAPGLDAARLGSRFVTTNSFSFTVQPTIGSSGAPYQMEVTHASFSSISTNIVMSITSPDCDISTATTAAFQKDQGANSWVLIGIITNHPGVASPAITFAWASGAVGPSPQNRVYVDGFRFSNTGLNPCAQFGPPQLASVVTPLYAGQNFVQVPNVDSLATNVTVYADEVKIGSVVPIPNATVQVPTTPLIAGQFIKVTQWENGYESCRQGLHMAEVTAPPSPGAIFFAVGQSGLTLNWAGFYTLQSATNIVGPFNDLSARPIAGPYITNALESARFYRLR